MKKTYEKVEITVAYLGLEDIITTSEPSIEDTDLEGTKDPW